MSKGGHENQDEMPRGPLPESCTGFSILDVACNILSLSWLHAWLCTHDQWGPPDSRHLGAESTTRGRGPSTFVIEPQPMTKAVLWRLLSFRVIAAGELWDVVV